MCEWQCCALLHDSSVYQPDTLDLNNDTQAAEYWFPCVRDMIAKFATKAAASQFEEDPTAEERAAEFQRAYLECLADYQSKAAATQENHVVLGIRELLELNETQLRRFGFPDPWQRQKQSENTAALSLLAQRCSEVDQFKAGDERWTELVRGVLAGNMFDWGAQAVAQIMEEDKNFGLHAALQRIQCRPWLMDDLDRWLERLGSKEKPHKCAVIFVDNSGVDVVLGILPFARELLKRGTKVLLCANAEPSLNDVTSGELTALFDSGVACHCPVLAKAWSTQRLLVFGNGQRGPCLDMRKLPLELCEAIKIHETDLLIIEGMGRALHTNLYAKFNCETLKLAVIKNQWLAQRLGGETFAVMCKYECNS